MDVDIKKLAELAKLRFDEDELAEMERDMASIITLMDTLKDVKLIGEEDPADMIPITQLREDVALESLPEQVLTGQAPGKNGFSIPKIVE